MASFVTTIGTSASRVLTGWLWLDGVQSDAVLDPLRERSHLPQAREVRPVPLHEPVVCVDEPDLLKFTTLAVHAMYKRLEGHGSSNSGLSLSTWDDEYLLGEVSEALYGTVCQRELKIVGRVFHVAEH